MKQKTNLVKVIGITLLSVLTVKAFSQEQKTSSEKELTAKIGIKGGLNLSNLRTTNDVTDEHVKLAGNFGVFAKLPVTTGFSIQPEILYSMKGAQFSYNNVVLGSGKLKYNLNYVEVPLLAVLNLTKNFNIHAGGYAAYLASVKIKDVDNSGNVNHTTELNKDNFEAFDYGLVGGIGFDVDNVTIGARYSYGLKEIGKSGIFAGDPSANAKNSAASLYIGFAF